MILIKKTINYFFKVNLINHLILYFFINGFIFLFQLIFNLFLNIFIFLVNLINYFLTLHVRIYL